MPYEIFKESKGVLKRFYGHVTFAEIFDSILDVHNDVDFDSFAYSIYDMLDMASFDGSDRALLEIRAHSVGARKTNPDLKVVIVTLDDGFVQALKRMIGTTKLDVLVVPTVAAARALF